MPFDQTRLSHDVAKRIARLLRILRDMEIQLIWMDLGRTMRGGYARRQGTDPYPGCDLIVLNPRLQGFQVVSTLGHEIAHAMFDDAESTPVTEERAQRIGSVLAVDPVEFRRARRAEDAKVRINCQYGLAPSTFAHLVGGEEMAAAATTTAAARGRLKEASRLIARTAGSYSRDHTAAPPASPTISPPHSGAGLSPCRCRRSTSR